MRNPGSRQPRSRKASATASATEARGVGLHQGDGRPTEAATGHARTEGTRCPGCLDGDVQLVAADLVVDPQGLVRGVHQRADLADPTVADEVDELLDAGDLGDDVPHAHLLDRVRQRGQGRVEVGDLAQGADPEPCRGGVAGGATGGVLAVDERVLGPGVDDQQLEARLGQVERAPGRRCGRGCPAAGHARRWRAGTRPGPCLPWERQRPRSRPGRTWLPAAPGRSRPWRPVPGRTAHRGPGRQHTRWPPRTRARPRAGRRSRWRRRTRRGCGRPGPATTRGRRRRPPRSATSPGAIPARVPVQTSSGDREDTRRTTWSSRRRTAANVRCGRAIGRHSPPL